MVLPVHGLPVHAFSILQYTETYTVVFLSSSLEIEKISTVFCLLYFYAVLYDLVDYITHRDILKNKVNEFS